MEMKVEQWGTAGEWESAAITRSTRSINAGHVPDVCFLPPAAMDRKERYAYARWTRAIEYGQGDYSTERAGRSSDTDDS